jgi:hypothetical protein
MKTLLIFGFIGVFSFSTKAQQIKENTIVEQKSSFALPGTYKVIHSKNEKSFLSKNALEQIELLRNINEIVTVEIEGFKIEIMSRENMETGLRWI